MQLGRTFLADEDHPETRDEAVLSHGLWDVLQMVLRQGLGLAATGLVVGLIASVMLTRFLTSLLFEVKPADLMTTLAVLATLALVALLANYVPARRASRVDPNQALRCE